MKHIQTFEGFLNESTFPGIVDGNDEIKWVKEWERNGQAHYRAFYKGHEIEFGGVTFNNEKSLNKFIGEYILSNNLYAKLKYETPKELPKPAK